jgi:hypothetical protein
MFAAHVLRHLLLSISAPVAERFGFLFFFLYFMSDLCTCEKGARVYLTRISL